jgi:hypothetical protein
LGEKGGKRRVFSGAEPALLRKQPLHLTKEKNLSQTMREDTNLTGGGREKERHFRGKENNWQEEGIFCGRGARRKPLFVRQSKNDE